MVVYQLLTEGASLEAREDIDAAIAGLPLPSEVRAKAARAEQNRAAIMQMAAEGLIEIG